MAVMARSAPVFSGDAESIFLATKISAPRVSARWVQRPRLLSRLGVPAVSRISLVHAGPGFGKTALLAQWHNELVLAGVQTAWLSVDANDDDIHIYIGSVSYTHLTLPTKRIV